MYDLLFNAGDKAKGTEAFNRIASGSEDNSLLPWAQDTYVQGSNERQAAVERARREAPLGETLSVGLADASASPLSHLSVIPLLNEITGPLSGLDVAGQEYTSGRLSDLSRARAAGRAVAQGVAEAAPAMVPAGKFIPGLQGIEKYALTRALGKTAALRAARAVGGEVMEENVTTAAQLGIDKYLADNSNDKATKAFAAQNLPQTKADVWDAFLRTTMAAGIGAGTIAGPMEGFRTVQEGAQQAEHLTNALDNSIATRNKNRKAIKPGPIETQLLNLKGEVTPEQQKALDERKSAEIDIAYAQNEISRIRRNGSPATLDTDFAAINELQSKIKDLEQVGKPAPEPVAEPAPEVTPVTPAKKIKKSAKQKTAEKQAKEEQSVQDAFTELAKKAGVKAQVTDGETTGTTLEDVKSALLGSTSQAGTRQIAELSKKGQVQFVEDVSEIPETEGVQQKGKGFYSPKTGKTYIVANQLDSKNTKADILSVLAHEVKHGADLGGSKKLRGSFKNLVGEKANNSIVSKIENLAKQNTAEGRRAKSIVDQVKSGYSAEDYKLELPAHFINEAMTGKSGIGRSILSPARATFKKMTGSEDLNLDDLRYVAKQLVKEAATSSDTFNPTSDTAKAMILSGGKSADTALKENRTWLSADGARKYELPDDESHVMYPENPDYNKAYKASEILNHPALYKDIPEAANVKVRLHNEPDSRYGGYYNDASNTVHINMAMIPGKVNAFNGLGHQWIIHEMQHAMQAKAGTTNGASPEDFLSNEGKKWLQKEKDATEALNYAKSIGMPAAEYADIEDDLKTAEDNLRPHWKEAEKKYGQVGGEQEAYFTQGRIAKNATERYDDTFGLGTNPEQQFIERDGGYYSEKGKRLDKAGAKPRTKPLAQIKVSSDPVVQGAFDTLIYNAQRLLSPYKGYGKELYNEQIEKESQESSLGVEAENLSRQLRTAFDKGAKEAGMDVEAFKNSMADRIDKIDELPTPEQRRTAIAALDKVAPELGTTLNAIRDLKWQRSQDIIADRMKTIKEDPMDKDELKIFNAIVSNRERYTTRAYLTQLGGKEGSKYARDFLRRANENPDSQEGKDLQAAIDWIVDNELTISDAETMAKKPMPYVKSMYSTWIGDASKFKGEKGKAKMIERLLTVGEQNRDQMEAEALNVVRQIMGVGGKANQSPIAAKFKGVKQDRTIVEQRTKVPEVLRKVMGEVTDPHLREVLSLARLNQFVTRTRMLNAVYDKGEGKWWSNTESAEFSHRLPGNAYGPLSGKYLSTPANDMIADVIEAGKSLGNFLIL